MSKPYSTVVFIGRFQPVHNAHIEILKMAFTFADEVVVIIGSANQPRTYKNPFNADERHCMITEAIEPFIPKGAEFRIEHNPDTIYNDQAWAIRVQEKVGRFDGEVAIIGHDKDDSTYYLKMFPQWSVIEAPLFEPLHSTEIRDLYFKEPNNMNFIKNVVPNSTYEFLLDFCDYDDFKQIVKEREFIATYKKQYESLAYPPVFVTADAVVIQSGHILMIKRRSEPGKGLWALPGGFLNANTDKSVKDAAVRELKEETGIKVPLPVLYGSIHDEKVFDAISRSARGRTITHAFKFVLPDGPLPKVKGMDDAEKASWIPIGELNSATCFEDHYELITHFIGA